MCGKENFIISSSIKPLSSIFFVTPTSAKPTKGLELHSEV